MNRAQVAEALIKIAGPLSHSGFFKEDARLQKLVSSCDKEDLYDIADKHFSPEPGSALPITSLFAVFESGFDLARQAKGKPVYAAFYEKYVKDSKRVEYNFNSVFFFIGDLKQIMAKIRKVCGK